MTTNAENVIVDFYDTVLAALAWYGQATALQVTLIVTNHPSAQGKTQREVEETVKDELDKLVGNDYAKRSWRKDTYKITPRGRRRSESKPCERCGSRGWCTCHD